MRSEVRGSLERHLPRSLPTEDELFAMRRAAWRKQGIVVIRLGRRPRRDRPAGAGQRGDAALRPAGGGVMARRKRKTLGACVVAGLPVIQRQDDVLEPVYEADPDGRPVVHHRTVDTLGIMLRAGTITKDMHDAARDFQAQFTIACSIPFVCMPFDAIAASERADRSDRRPGRRATTCRRGDGCARRPRQPGRRLCLARRRSAALDPRVGDASGLGRPAGQREAGAGHPGGGAGCSGEPLRVRCPKESRADRGRN